MLPSTNDTNNGDDNGGCGYGSETESSRKSTIFTVTIDGVGHIPFTNIDLNKTTPTSITTTDSISFSVDFNVAAEKCATMILSAIFESMSLKPDSIHSQLIAMPKPGLATVSEKLLEGAKLDDYLLSNTSKHYTRSLSKSDLLELKRNIVKSHLKPVQDPLSASKLRKNYSVDCHPWHSPIFEISSLDSSRYASESIINCDEIDSSRSFVFFPSIRYAFFNIYAFLIHISENR